MHGDELLDLAPNHGILGLVKWSKKGMLVYGDEMRGSEGVRFILELARAVPDETSANGLPFPALVSKPGGYVSNRLSPPAVEAGDNESATGWDGLDLNPSIDESVLVDAPFKSLSSRSVSSVSGLMMLASENCGWCLGVALNGDLRAQFAPKGECSACVMSKLSGKALDRTICSRSS
jgi:hypothetical protein